LCGISKPNVQQVATDEGTCAAFSSIAVNSDHIFFVLGQKVVHFRACFEQCDEIWGMMIFPFWKMEKSVAKSLFLSIVVTLF
jgi:hypothetical protein